MILFKNGGQIDYPCEICKKTIIKGSPYYRDEGPIFKRVHPICKDKPAVLKVAWISKAKPHKSKAIFDCHGIGPNDVALFNDDGTREVITRKAHEKRLEKEDKNV